MTSAMSAARLARGGYASPSIPSKELTLGQHNDAHIQLRCRSSEKSRWQDLAQSDGQSLSDWIRSQLDGSSANRRRRRRIDVDPALIRQLAGISNNLNQLARWANTRRSAADAADVITHLIALDRSVKELADLMQQVSDAD